MNRGNNIEVFYFFLVYCFEILEKNGIFLETLLSISKSEAGGVLSDVLKISRI